MSAMHMADALISPAVGGTMWAAAAGLTVYSAKKLKEGLDDSKVPLMGVLGAFVFAAQMINFTIPGTGSSGHLGGGMLLAILLGPHAAFLTMASILTVQALFFADGGLLALGCNLFNLGFFTCFVAYPLIYRKLVGAQPSRRRVLLSAMTASVVGLQMGACGVVLETLFSGISDLPFATFAAPRGPGSAFLARNQAAACHQKCDRRIPAGGSRDWRCPFLVRLDPSRRAGMGHAPHLRQGRA
jgi:cobalt/nickel transport system permease protein